MNQDIFETVKTVVNIEFNIEEARIIPESSFRNDLGIVSIDMYELFMELEEKFGIDIPEKAIDGFKYISDAVGYIESKIS